ncbi:hypothetical protein T07_9600 [Trichinella nelsoni]|uniref:Uncharacterized protein n=1 Tax=Trichinella nelsoni TaxID=6336 RepID=A0A0V0S5U6_9BILA|nr:hypothetical protein T07_9600 [Trichinella nelsoni]
MYQRRLYLEELGKALVAPQILRRKRLPRALMSAHFVQKIQSEEQGTSQSTVQAALNTNKLPDINSAKPQTTKHLPAPILVSIACFEQKITRIYISLKIKISATLLILSTNNIKIILIYV